MSMFKSKHLKSLHEKGKLNNILKHFGECINKQNFIGAGGDASAFKYNELEVIKVCSKNINYFNYFNKNAKVMKHKIDTLQPYFLPMNDVLYDGKNIIIYTQNICEIVCWDQLTKEMVQNIFKIVLLTIKHDLYINMSKHNLAIFDDKLCVFDYHGMKSINWKKKDNWWNRCMRHLTKYISHIYNCENRNKYNTYMKKYNVKVYKKFQKDNLLPPCFMHLLKYNL
jgi:hypothetical protein